VCSPLRGYVPPPRTTRSETHVTPKKNSFHHPRQIGLNLISLAWSCAGCSGCLSPPLPSSDGRVGVRGLDHVLYMPLLTWASPPLRHTRQIASDCELSSSYGMHRIMSRKCIAPRHGISRPLSRSRASQIHRGRRETRCDVLITLEEVLSVVFSRRGWEGKEGEDLRRPSFCESKMQDLLV